jgi:glucose dehydrogenase
MRPTRLVLALVLALAGLVWVGQGLGFIAGSFMTGSPFWAIVGAAMVVLAVLTVAMERRRAA